MTIKEACLQSLQDLTGTATVNELYDHIITNNYYDFGNAPTPKATVHSRMGELRNDGIVIRENSGAYSLNGNYALPNIVRKKEMYIENIKHTNDIKVVSLDSHYEENKNSNHDETVFVTLFDKLRNKRNNSATTLMDFEYRGIWETAIKKYSAKAPFVYELLQNADDAQATWVEFELEPDGCWFKHNGNKFTISDIDNTEADTYNGNLGDLNAITSIGNSSKLDDGQKIGKFGIGFKSVFAYSKTPEIHDDNFSFKLVDYIVPIAIQPQNNKRKIGETLFYFPFNHDKKSPEEAFLEIEEKLMVLVQPILFLNNVESIQWCTPSNNGKYENIIISKEEFQDTESQFLKLTNVKNNVSITEYVWLFSRKIKISDNNQTHKVSVGFFVDAENRLRTDIRYDAFCFFPTKEKTNFGFIIQAPFLLTDNREGIRAGEKINTDLIQHLADLAAYSILCIKDIGIRENSFIIDDSILDIIPYNINDYSNSNNNEKISFKPFYDAILKLFQSKEIIPGKSTGKYFEKNKAYWVTDNRISEVFDDNKISKLLDNTNSGWVLHTKWTKTINANKSLYSYIAQITREPVDEIKLLGKMTAEFIENQTDEWLLVFYSYLAEKPAIFDKAKKTPIILNQNRKAIVPFSESGIPKIHLSPVELPGLDTVYQPFYENIEAGKFFEILGIKEPDAKSEIYHIIHQYQNNPNFSERVRRHHFEKFITFYGEILRYEQSEFITHLKEIKFIVAYENCNRDISVYCLSQEVYLNDEHLQLFFSKCKDVLYLDEEFYSVIFEKFGREKVIHL